jgi:hypothetical protein
VPKRRGPDKDPGTRIRQWRRRPQGYIDPQTTQRSNRAQTQNQGRDDEDESDELLRAVPESVQRSVTQTQTQLEIETLNQVQMEMHAQIQAQLEAQFLMQMQTHGQTRMSSEEYDSVSPPSTSAGPSSTFGPYYHHYQHTGILSPNFHDAVSMSQYPSTGAEESSNPFRFSSQMGTGIEYPDPIHSQSSPDAPGSLRHSVPVQSDPSTNYGHFYPSTTVNDIPRGPSVTFNKDTWWENLIQTYCDDPSKSAEKICLDITFL